MFPGDWRLSGTFAGDWRLRGTLPGDCCESGVLVVARRFPAETGACCWPRGTLADDGPASERCR